MLNLFKSKSKGSFFSNYDIELEEGEATHEILSQTRVDKRTAELLEGAMKIEYKNGIANKVHWIEEGDYIEEDEPTFEKAPVIFKDYPINTYKVLISHKQGQHKLGGEIPTDFKLPRNNTQTPYVYLGKLNCDRENSLTWTKIDQFQMICPMFADFDIIFLDYTNPNAPILVNPQDVEDCGSAYDDLKTDDEIVFKELSVRMEDIKRNQTEEDVIGNIGAPIWIQGDRIPICPKSGKKMKFLVMLDTSDKVQFNRSTVDIKDESMRRYLESFNFWCDGCLFIFFEPESKMAAYYIQNT